MNKSESKSNAPSETDDLKSIHMQELQTKLGSSLEGLSQAEAQKRLTQYGPNEIEEKKTNSFLKFLAYFWGSIPWMIEAGVSLGWRPYIGPGIATIRVDRFGSSAPGEIVMHEYGFSVENVLQQALALIKQQKKT